jgi:short-subunit dehydrogenase
MATRGKLAAVITGSSNGIDEEIARKFAMEGHDVVITSENRIKLEKAYYLLRKFAPNVGIELIVADLSTPGGAKRLYDEVRAMNVAIDVLVNNAGVGLWGKFTETDLRDEDAMMQVNMISVVTLTKLFLPQMVRLNRGKIVFTTAEAAVIPNALLTVYSATKAFVCAFARGLKSELKGTKISVTSLVPRATNTNFFKRAGAGHTKMARGKLANPADVAEEAYQIMMRENDGMVAPVMERLKVLAAHMQPAAP